MSYQCPVCHKNCVEELLVGEQFYVTAMESVKKINPLGIAFGIGRYAKAFGESFLEVGLAIDFDKFSKTMNSKTLSLDSCYKCYNCKSIVFKCFKCDNLFSVGLGYPQKWQKFTCPYCSKKIMYV